MTSYLACVFCPFSVSVPEAQPSRAASLGTHVFAPSPWTFSCTRVQLEAANWQLQEAQLSSRPPWPVRLWTQVEPSTKCHGTSQDKPWQL